MKLAVVIPAFNEENTISKVIKNIPKDCADSVIIIVVDDGSTDDTYKEAVKAGADKIVRHRQNMGLAKTFRDGLEAALKTEADIIVNIDADGQYEEKEICKIIEPIINGEADIVLGSRFLGWIEEMPFRKKLGNKISTWVTSFASGMKLSDAQTGFRAFSREAALHINVMSDYTYVQETIIQAVSKGFKIVEVPIKFYRREGKSRLISSIFKYAKLAGATILKTHLYYKPLRTFVLIGSAVFFVGLLLSARVLIHYIITGMVTPYLPTAILSAILLIVGFQTIVLGLIADMIGANRKIQEEILYKLRKKK
ncbi:MAG TPA: glycosyltransferase family 2 protein [Thermoplasmata archaeon]|nr:glycosyltransferase family 2 protein [Thermoplasmata archaeon]